MDFTAWLILFLISSTAASLAWHHFNEMIDFPDGEYVTKGYVINVPKLENSKFQIRRMDWLVLKFRQKFNI